MSEATICTPYDAAVDAVKRGMAVIPVHAITDKYPGRCTCKRPDCPHPGKHPVEDKWQRSTYISTADCWTLWKEDARNFNAGILTGAKSGVVLIDIDPRNGGTEQLAALEAKYGPMPDTYSTDTGSKGTHFYFSLPPGMIINSGKLRDADGNKLDGIDVLSNGRMAVLPGSVSASGPYSVTPGKMGKPILPLLDWIIPLTPQDGAKAGGEIIMAADLPTRSQLPAQQQERCHRYAIKVIEAESEAYATAPWGQGNDRLFMACCNILEILQSPWSGVDVDYARARLEAARVKRLAAAKAGGKGNGATISEVDITWESARKRVAGKGRKLPEDNDSRWEGILFDAPFVTGSPMVSGAPLVTSSPLVSGSPFMQPNEAEAAALDSLEGEGVQITEADRVQFAQAERQAQWEAAVRQEAVKHQLAKAGKEYAETGVIPGTGETGRADRVAALRAKLLRPSDLDKLPNPRYLIRNLLKTNSECWLVAPPGSFKSFVALDIAAHVESGTPWRGERTEKGSVIYVVAEGADGIKLRKQAWEISYGPMGEGVEFLPEPVQALDTQAWDDLVELCREIDPALIILDTQSRLTVGIDENSPLMNIYVEAVRKLRAATRACVLTLHHPRQGGVMMRGHGSTLGASDSVIILTRPDDDRHLLTATISLGKQKEGDEGLKWEIQMEKHDLGFDPETGDELNSLALMPKPPFAQPAAPKKPEWEERLADSQSIILQVMRDHADRETGATRGMILKWVAERLEEKGAPPMVVGTVDTGLRRLKEGDVRVLTQDGSRYFLNEPK